MKCLLSSQWNLFLNMTHTHIHTCTHTHTDNIMNITPQTNEEKNTQLLKTFTHNLVKSQGKKKQRIPTNRKGTYTTDELFHNQVNFRFQPHNFYSSPNTVTAFWHSTDTHHRYATAHNSRSNTEYAIIFLQVNIFMKLPRILVSEHGLT